jgi:hypothetical protein
MDAGHPSETLKFSRKAILFNDLRLFRQLVANPLDTHEIQVSGVFDAWCSLRFCRV